MANGEACAHTSNVMKSSVLKTTSMRPSANLHKCPFLFWARLGECASIEWASSPCYRATNFSAPTTAFFRQRHDQFRGLGYFDTDFDVQKSLVEVFGVAAIALTAQLGGFLAACTPDRSRSREQFFVIFLSRQEYLCITGSFIR
jgi:hypothetical protein